jgi:hypothetical protein
MVNAGVRPLLSGPNAELPSQGQRARSFHGRLRFARGRIWSWACA